MKGVKKDNAIDDFLDRSYREIKLIELRQMQRNIIRHRTVDQIAEFPIEFLQLVTSTGANIAHLAVLYYKIGLLNYINNTPQLKCLIDTPDHKGKTPEDYSRVLHNTDLDHFFLTR